MTKRQFKAALKQIGMSQRSFARLVARVDERTVRNWVSGRSKVPNTVEALLKRMIDAST